MGKGEVHVVFDHTSLIAYKIMLIKSIQYFKNQHFLVKTRITSCLFDKNIFFWLENQITVYINFCGFVFPEKLLGHVDINPSLVHLIVPFNTT